MIEIKSSLLVIFGF